MPFIQICDPPESGPFKWSRKLFHMLGLLIPFIYYFDVFRGLGSFEDPTRSMGLIILFVLTIIVVCVELFRFYNQAFNDFFHKIFGPLLKDDERDQFSAVTPYLISCIILIFFCSKIVVCVCCIFLMIGDPFAAYVGSKFGRIRFWNKKSLEGIIAFVIFGYLASLLFLGMHSLLEPNSYFSLYRPGADINFEILIITFWGAFLAALAEFFSTVSFKGLMDDNLIVPLGGALGIILTVYLIYAHNMQLFLINNLAFF